MYKVSINEQFFYFKNRATLVDFLDDNLSRDDENFIPFRKFVIEDV